MNDEFLIQEFNSGNVSAFNTLVWRWEKPIFNFILRYIGDHDQAKDVMQRCFIRAFKSLGKLKNHARFSTWLYQIALNLCRDELKKRKYLTYSISEVRDYDDSDDKVNKVVIVDQSQDPTRHVYREDLAKLLQKALMSIPEEQRVVIIMKQYHGLKFTEIAEILKTPLNTIKSRMYYGLEALQKVLNKWGVDREDLGYEM
ncbi:MAG: sigma-70 family RNA polymerase sigma factor [Candidatus Marinimicrobia bacterium]|nr:sigma-70 family RNA polymerase sigma factor [Candidatus Neomarinimicrobiota bacterium]